jgi:hypothetical protein
MRADAVHTHRRTGPARALSEPVPSRQSVGPVRRQRDHEHLHLACARSAPVRGKDDAREIVVDAGRTTRPPDPSSTAKTWSSIQV